MLIRKDSKIEIKHKMDEKVNSCSWCICFGFKESETIDK